MIDQLVTRSNYQQPPLYFMARLVQFLLYLVEILLIFRFALKFFNANVDAGFTTFIYLMTDILVQPFAAVLNAWQVDSATIEGSVLIAMVVYGIIAWVLIQLFSIGGKYTAETVQTSIPQQPQPPIMPIIMPQMPPVQPIVQAQPTQPTPPPVIETPTQQQPPVV